MYVYCTKAALAYKSTEVNTSPEYYLALHTSPFSNCRHFMDYMVMYHLVTQVLLNANIPAFGYYL
jgi:hypothetical protein